MAVYINPNYIWHLSFLGFAFPFAVLVNIIFVIVFAIKKSWFALVPLAAVLLCYQFIGSTFSFNLSKADDTKGIKLMTWNVKNFDLYNWSHNKETRHEMIKVVKDADADIICFQEFYSDNGKILNNEKFFKDTLGYKYYYFQPTIQQGKNAKTKYQTKLWGGEHITQKWGVAIFSRYPIIDTGRLDFANSRTNDCIYADLNVNNETLRVYTTHLQSIKLGEEDYDNIDSMEISKKPDWQSVKSIMKKMRLAYRRRATQADVLAEHAEAYKGKKLICGDFNDIPVSYTYHTVSKGLKDSFIAKGFGFGATYSHDFSIFRIDYALFDPHIAIHSHQVLRYSLSDHYPLCVNFSL
jgi:endonuclease/exonuclease/phosphatase family metal-dependent hydrolase